jgi:serine/threonine-protein kinase
MGSVWAATHLALETPVAIKFMTWTAPQAEETANRDAGGDDDAVERATRFEREAKAAAQIRSANVVQVFDYGLERGVPFIVMELLVGEDLQKRLQREGRLSPEATARLTQSITRALQRAHDLGLVHRDLKPGNIFLAKEGDHEVPKVVDFGVVKALPGQQRLATEGSENTVEGTLIGTPSYMSPEQAMGRTNVDHRSDLWSLGVILYQTLTGMKPFASGHLFEALVRICSDPIPRASSLVPGLPAGIDAFFDRALERDIGKRFQSAREMERAFYALVARPAHSIPPEADVLTGPSEALWEDPDSEEQTAEQRWFSRRPRSRLLLLGAVGLGAVIAAGFALSQTRRTPTAGETLIVVGSGAGGASAAPSTAAAPPPETSEIPTTPVAPSEVPTVAAPSATAPASTRAAGAARPPTAPHPAHKPKRDLGY